MLVAGHGVATVLAGAWHIHAVMPIQYCSSNGPRPKHIDACMPAPVCGIVMYFRPFMPAVNPGKYTLFDGFAHLASGLSCGLAGLAAGMAIGIVGDAGVRWVADC